MPLIFPTTLKNTSFMIFFRKNAYCGNIQCFFFIFLCKQWNKQKIIEKFTFSVKGTFFVKWHISFFSELKIRWSFLDKMLILLKMLEIGYFMQFWETKMNSIKKLIYFLLFPSFSFKTCKWKEKKHWKILFLKEMYIFFIEMAFYVTWKKDFLQNVPKTNKRV